MTEPAQGYRPVLIEAKDTVMLKVEIAEALDLCPVEYTMRLGDPTYAQGKWVCIAHYRPDPKMVQGRKLEPTAQ